MRSGRMEKPYFLQNKAYIKLVIISLLLLLCIGVTYYAHFVLRRSILFSHFFYVPVVLAAFWWGRKGIWVSAFLGALLISTHLLLALDTLYTYNIFRAGLFLIIAYIIGTLREESLNTQRRLQNTRNYLNSLIQYSNTPIVVWDNQGKITLFNPALEKLTGYTANEMLGRSVLDLIPEECHKDFSHLTDKALKGQPCEEEEVLVRCKNGQDVVCLWSSAAVFSP